MNIRLTQLDGKLPNLALMKLAHFHKSRGDEIVFSKRPERDMLEGHYGLVYGSAIFSSSAERVAVFCRDFPNAVVGGTWNPANGTTVEQLLSRDEYEHYDYSIYPGFTASIGFTQRGCRLKCGFCVVPTKEGKNRGLNTIANIWRGGNYPRHLHLLDNDFFGQPHWRDRIAEIIDGRFKVCFNQGVNVRLIDQDAAKALASIHYCDDQFKTRRLYTAWDNLKDEKVFLRGVDLLERCGVNPAHLLVYMLIGWDKAETWERIFHRFNRMAERGMRPYPMIYGDRARTLPLGDLKQRLDRRTLGEFQRWAIRKAYTFIPFEAYAVNAKGHMTTAQTDLFVESA